MHDGILNMPLTNYYALYNPKKLHRATLDEIDLIGKEILMADITKMNRDEILDKIANTGTNDMTYFAKYQSAILVRCFESLEKSTDRLSSSVNLVSDNIDKSLRKLTESLEKNQQSSDALGRKVFWLNIVLTVATIIMAVVAVIQVFDC